MTQLDKSLIEMMDGLNIKNKNFIVWLYFKQLPPQKLEPGLLKLRFIFKYSNTFLYINENKVLDFPGPAETQCYQYQPVTGTSIEQSFKRKFETETGNHCVSGVKAG